MLDAAARLDPWHLPACGAQEAIQAEEKKIGEMALARHKDCHQRMTVPV